MSDYWEEHFDKKCIQSRDSLLKQVEKTVGGKEVGEDQVDLVVDTITERLGLSSADNVIDLCCGNGVITHRVAPLVNKVIGFDVSTEMIKVAKTHNQAGNIVYVRSNVVDIDKQYYDGINKLYMNESLQHMTPDMLERLLDNLSFLMQGALVYISGIPDKTRLRSFYNTEEKYAYYLKCENESRPHVGYWWTKEEVREIASRRGYIVNEFSQHPNLNTAYYRFDVLLKKK